MFNDLRDKLFLRKIGKKFKSPIRKLYSKKITKYNIKIAKLIYKNLARRYGTTVKEIYNTLPLTIKVNKDLEGAYGLCQVKPVVKKKLFKKKEIKTVESTIFLNGKDVTTTTFVHEFGHYLRFLIGQLAFKKNKKALEDFKNIVDLVRSREDVYKNKYNNFFIRGYFTVDEEENFAKSWEQYLKDGKAPDKAHAKLFRDFRKNIFDDMHLRSEKRNYEFYEDLEVKITPERKQFFDILIIGKRLKKESIIIKILEWYIYISVFAIIIKLINDHIIKIY